MGNCNSCLNFDRTPPSSPGRALKRYVPSTSRRRLWNNRRDMCTFLFSSPLHSTHFHDTAPTPEVYMHIQHMLLLHQNASHTFEGPVRYRSGRGRPSHMFGPIAPFNACTHAFLSFRYACKKLNSNIMPVRNGSIRIRSSRIRTAQLCVHSVHYT